MSAEQIPGQMTVEECIAEAKPAIESGQSTGTVEVTPSGIEVYYQSKPKRLYRIRKASGTPDPDVYAPDWREVPSVTTVLGVLDKPALPWWGMKTGVQGVLSLYEDGLLVGNGSPETTYLAHNGFGRATVDTVVDLLTMYKLTVNHVRDKAGDRGQSVHDAFEAWARTGLKPDPSIYPDEERGYVEGLLAFLADVPSIEPIAAEVLVASAEHGFAGRYDIRFRTWQPHDVVVHRTPKRGPTYRRLAPGMLLGDLKTSKGTYPTHALQLEAYEQASLESGYEPTTARAVLHVNADGTYELKRVKASIDDFLAVLNVWQRFQNAKEWLAVSDERA